MKRLAVVLILLVPVGLFADAPETATVSGTVVDPGGSPLPGVSITLSSERGDKFSITDDNGNFRFVGVVPDDYTLKAELQGLGEASASLHAGAGDRKSIDMTLQAAIEGELTVTGETPMVDKFNVTAGSTVTSEIGEQTAGTTRTYYGVINALPGVTADARNDDIQQTRPSVNGTHFADQGVYIDGVDTTFAKFGGSRVFLPTTAVTEVSMEAGGSSAEYGRYIGSSTNVIVKSGTNRWHVDALWQRQAVDWGSDYKDQSALAERQNKPYPVDWFRRCHGDDRDATRGLIPGGTDVTERFNTNREPCLPGSDEWAGASDGFEFSAGGPIRRDKFWFFLGWSEFDDAYAERLLGGDPYDISLFNDARIFKLNMQPSPNHSLAASAIDTPAYRNYFNDQSSDYWTPTPHENDSVLSTINWNYAISGNWFLEAKLAQQETQENKYLACYNKLEEENPAVQSVDGIPILEWLSQDNFPNASARMVETCLQAKSLDRGPIAGHSPVNTSGGDSSYPLRFPFDPSKGIFYPGNNYNVYRDDENLSAWHNGWILSDGFGFNAFPRDQANVGLTQFVGANHELKYGLDYQDTKWEGENARVPLFNGWGFDSTNKWGWLDAGEDVLDSCSVFRNSGTNPDNPTAPWDGVRTNRGRGCYFVDYNSTLLTCDGLAGDGLPHRPTQIDRVNGEIVRTPGTCVGPGTGDTEVRDTGIYIRDRFTIGDHWTFNLGLRAENQEAWNDVRRQVVDDTYVDPRINITYDVKGDGALLLNTTYGQYHAMLNQAWISGGDVARPSMHDLWNGYEGREVFLFCDPGDVASADLLGALGFINWSCRTPQRRDSLRDGTVGAALPGYNVSWGTGATGSHVGRGPGRHLRLRCADLLQGRVDHRTGMAVPS